MIRVELEGRDFVDALVGRLREQSLRRRLIDALGTEVTSQTQRRIGQEKSDPSGTPWREWSRGYASSRHGSGNHGAHAGQLRESGGHSLLELSGHLLQSIRHQASDDSVSVGSDLVYARRQNFARQFMGLSRENESDLEEIMHDLVGSHLGVSS